MVIGSYISIITLNVNRLNALTKRQPGRMDQPQEKKKNAQSTNIWRLNNMLLKKPMDH